MGGTLKKKNHCLVNAVIEVFCNAVAIVSIVPIVEEAVHLLLLGRSLAFVKP